MHPSFQLDPSASSFGRASSLALLLSSALVVPTAAHAATVCVDQHGKAGCFHTISEGLAAAAPGDTVKVGPGFYHESVLIKQSVSLIGRDRDSTIIDATGLSNGIFINGFDNPALGFGDVDEVTVTGFTVRNANYEGILLANVSHATIWGNRVISNDQLLAGASCSGLPAFETGETADCGGGLHLIGVIHSTVSDNVVEGNAAGIKLTDETTTTHDNVIARNLVLNNKHSAGVALASYLAYVPQDLPHPGVQTYGNGVYNNLLIHNQLLHNGGPGLVIVAPVGGTRAYANSVTTNRIFGNGGAGLEIHGGATTVAGVKNGDASRNTIFGNFLAENGADAYLATGVPTGISIGGQANVIDTLVTNNVIEGESIAVAFNSASTLDLHLNDLVVGRKVGVANLNAAGTVNATENWWGCTGGPGAPGCSGVTGAVTYSPWLSWAADATHGHGHDLLFDALCSFGQMREDEMHEHGFDF